MASIEDFILFVSTCVFVCCGTLSEKNNISAGKSVDDMIMIANLTCLQVPSSIFCMLLFCVSTNRFFFYQTQNA